MRILVLFPTQLYIEQVKHVCREKSIEYVYILQDPRYFRYKDAHSGLIRHHPYKLLLHDVSTRLFQRELKTPSTLIDFSTWVGRECLGGETLGSIPIKKGDEWTVFDPIDHYLLSKIQQYTKKNDIALTVLESPLFILTTTELQEIRQKSRGKLIRQTPFYAEVRHRKAILMTPQGRPVNNRLTYDTENRAPLPRGEESVIPTYFSHGYKRTALEKKTIRESLVRIQRSFADHPGRWDTFALADYYAHIDFTRKGALARLAQFCRERLVHFGEYQDAMVAGDNANPILYHSGISHLLNIGLLTPMEVIDIVLTEWKKSALPIASVEGFIRQIIGWREYTRYIYVYWNDEIRRSNAMGATNKLNDAWYTGTTGWTPVDHSIEQAFRYGYLHHIQRLMIMGNIMNLLRINPHEVYRWFMEFAIDSYEWVMVYNVYCMILYADGGKTTTKPYISSSAYIYKMSNGRFKRDGKWDVDWTTLFYSYIGDHPTQLEHNGRTIQMWNLWKRKSSAEQRDIRRVANAIINRLARK
jgi:deoxyribodipyrimidine photolyase-related protein